METSICIARYTKRIIVSEGLNSVETVKALKVRGIGLTFQKDLIVWKPGKTTIRKIYTVTVSEGLNSVETYLCSHNTHQAYRFRRT